MFDVTIPQQLKFWAEPEYIPLYLIQGIDICSDPLAEGVGDNFMLRNEGALVEVDGEQYRVLYGNDGKLYYTEPVKTTEWQLNPPPPGLVHNMQAPTKVIQTSAERKAEYRQEFMQDVVNNVGLLPEKIRLNILRSFRRDFDRLGIDLDEMCKLVGI